VSLLITAELEEVHLKETFRTSRGEADSKVVCVVKVDDSLGECCPSLHYGYSAEECHDSINSMQMSIDTENFELDSLLAELSQHCGDRYSMLAGLDIALHDYAAKRTDQPLWRYLNLLDPAERESSYTISIVEPRKLEQRLEAAGEFRVLKLKLGCEYDEENLELLGRLPGRTIRVDANGALTMNNIEWLIRAAHDLELELIEEPLAEPRLSDLKELQAEVKCPIVLDESIKTVRDVMKYEGCIGGVNVKLQKVGGIAKSLEIIRAARMLEMKVMIGCMLETSIGISAAANLAGSADYLDLDSSTLLSDDPFDGVVLVNGKLSLPIRIGHAAMRKSELENSK